MLKKKKVESVLPLNRAVLSLSGSDHSVGPVGAQAWALVVSVNVTFKTPPELMA